MTDQEICELFDTNINMTLKELSAEQVNHSEN